MNIKPNKTTLTIIRNRLKLARHTIADKLYNPKRLSEFKRTQERARGVWQAEILNDKNSLQDTLYVVRNEIFRGNFDFMKGLNKTLNKEMAKKVYSLL